MRILAYLAGEPGTGKTTAMRRFTDRWLRVPLAGCPARDALADPRTGVVGAVELGRRRGTFSGTDALPMDVVVAAEAYLRHGRAALEAPVLLAEGARLANRRFLAAAVEAGYDAHLVVLDGPAVAAARRAARGTGQSEAWVRGAATRAARLAANPGAGVTVHLVPADDLDGAVVLLGRLTA